MPPTSTACASKGDEHVRKHTRCPGQPSSLVTTLVDLTPLAEGRAPARLLNMIPDRSTQALRYCLGERSDHLRRQVQVVTMDGFTGYATAVNQEVPEAVKIMAPFHVVRLAADKLTRCRQRLQRETTGRRGRKDDPLHKHRRTLLTRTGYLTDRQKQRLEILWATDDEYVGWS